MYTVTYKFNPNDLVWVLDSNSVKKGTCVQSVVKIAQKNKTDIQTVIEYLILLDCNSGTIWVDDANAYESLQDAIDALSLQMQTTSCPS
jgi:hypothetical protein